MRPRLCHSPRRTACSAKSTRHCAAKTTRRQCHGPRSQMFTESRLFPKRATWLLCKGWRCRSSLTDLGLSSTGRRQWLPWIPATICCATHVLNAMQNNTDLSTECRAGEKRGGQLPRRETLPRPLRVKIRAHVQQLLGTGIAHCALPLGGGDLHSEKHKWRFTGPKNTGGTPIANIDNTGDLHKISQKVELIFPHCPSITYNGLGFMSKSLRAPAGRRER